MLRIPTTQIRLLTSGPTANVVADSGGLQIRLGSLAPKDVKPMIGLEVHAQLKTRCKLFSQGSNSKEASPNSQLDLLDVSIPGSLPKLNRSAVTAGVITSLGLNCDVQNLIHFDRKNYFYTDMPAGYQITQYNKPIGLNGYVDFIVTDYNQSFTTNFAHTQHYDMVKHLYFDWWKQSEQTTPPYLKRSHIRQVQLEQDSAKTLHQVTSENEELNNLVDYNRSGVGLLEIVFEPDLTSPNEASSLVRDLIMILKALGTCDCELQEGSLRVDANVSIASIDNEKVAKEVSNRVELKNLNSLRSLHRGITYEIHRQATQILSGERVTQESRTFDTKTGQTIVMRTKETSVDYRYVPEPSIPPLRIDKALVQRIKNDLQANVTLPSAMRDLLEGSYGLTHALVVELLYEPGLARYFMAVMDCDKERAALSSDSVADFLIYSLKNLKNINKLAPVTDLEDDEGFLMKKLQPEKIYKLLQMVEDGEISYTIAYEIMKCLVTSGSESCPRELVQQFGWQQINDESVIDAHCANVISNMKSISKRYRRRGEKKDLRYMLDKLNELHDSRINVRVAMDCLNRRLRPESEVGTSKPPEIKKED